MKTKEYIKKYKLNESDKFNHSEFVGDFTIDFMTLLELGNSTENLKGFNNAVNAIKAKWDAVNNKTVGQIPEKLWKYFYGTVIIKFKEECFPEELKRRREEAKERKEYRERRKQEERQGFDDFFHRAFFYASFHKIFAANAKPVESFQVLGLVGNETDEQIKKAYRSLSMQFHPDKNKSKDAKDKFVQITEAKNKCLAYISK